MKEGGIILRRPGQCFGSSGREMGSHIAMCWHCVLSTRPPWSLVGWSWEAGGKFCTTALFLTQARLQMSFHWSFPSKLLSFSDYLSLLLQPNTNSVEGKILKWGRRNGGFTEVLQQVHSQKEWLRLFFFPMISGKDTL